MHGFKMHIGYKSIGPLIYEMIIENFNIVLHIGCNRIGLLVYKKIFILRCEINLNRPNLGFCHFLARISILITCGVC